MIIGIGAIAVDTVLFTVGSWGEGKGRLRERRVRMGGNVRTALVAAAALNAPTAYLGALSADDRWSMVPSDLTDHGVDLSLVEWDPGAAPIQSTIVVTADGERFIAFDDSVLATTPLPSARTVGRALDEATVLLVDASTAPPGSVSLVEDARARGIPVVVDAERFDPDTSAVEEILAAADHVILPKHFARSLVTTAVTDTELPLAVRDALGSSDETVVAVTDGEAGLYAGIVDARGRSVEYLPACRIPAVDTVGCGDVFHGAYAAALLQGLSVRDRLRLASAAAACVAALPEDAERIPDPRRVDELLNSSSWRRGGDDVVA